MQVLKRINELYGAGLSAGAPGSTGIKGIADALGLAKQIRKPRKKIRLKLGLQTRRTILHIYYLCRGGSSRCLPVQTAFKTAATVAAADHNLMHGGMLRSCLNALANRWGVS